MTRPRPAALTACTLASGALLLGATAIAPAQSRDGGVVLTFGLNQSLVIDDNPSLSPDGGTTRVTTLTGAELGYATSTRISAFAATASMGLRGVRSGGGGFETEGTAPRVNLSYTRDGATADLSLSASYTSDDIAFLNPLDLILDPDGNVIGAVLPDEFDALGGTGTRSVARLNGSLTLRKDAPLGVTLSFSHTDVDYEDVTDPDLQDIVTTTLGATARLNITEAMRANVGLGFTRVDEAGEAERETVTLSGDLSIARPDGSYGFGAQIVEAENGTRYNLSVSRVLELPNGTLNAQLGLGRSVNEDLFTTGSLSYRTVLPLGRIDARVERSISSSANADSDTVRTVVTARATRELTPLTTGSLGLSYAASENADTGEEISIGSLSATVNHQLSEDWSLSSTLSHEFRDEDGVGRGSANVLSFRLGRDFTWRY